MLTGPIFDGAAAEELGRCWSGPTPSKAGSRRARSLRSGLQSGGDRVALLRELDRLDSPEPMPIDDLRAALSEAFDSAGDDDRIWLGLANLATRTGDFLGAGRWLSMCERRRRTDLAVWRARVAWSMASGHAGVASRCVHLPPAVPVEEAEILGLQAWFARRAGDTGRERAALIGLLARRPANAEALQRFAELEQGEGHADRAQGLLARKADLLRDRLLYSERLALPDPEADAPELARLAEATGRPSEAHCWWEMALSLAPAAARAREALAWPARPGRRRRPPRASRTWRPRPRSPSRGGRPLSSFRPRRRSRPCVATNPSRERRTLERGRGNPLRSGRGEDNVGGA